MTSGMVLQVMSLQSGDERINQENRQKIVGRKHLYIRTISSHRFETNPTDLTQTAMLA